MIRKASIGLVMFASLISLALPSAAAVISFDKNGNSSGTVGQGFAAADPGPGGLAAALTYSLPFTGLQGDVLLLDITGSFLADDLRFNGDGTMIVYGAAPPVTAIADTGFPLGIYANSVFLVLVGTPANNGIVYTPTATQPGFDASNPTYAFFAVITAAESGVPEPSSIGLVIAGIGLIGFKAARRKRIA